MNTDNAKKQAAKINPAEAGFQQTHQECLPLIL